MFEKTFREYAEEIANRVQSRASRLEREIFDLEKTAAKKKAELNSANAHKRLANYQVQIGRDYQCPRCWIEREITASLRAIGGSTETEEFFRCNKCDERLPVPTK